MRTVVISLVIGAAILLAALQYGKHLAKSEYTNNAHRQVIIQGKTDEKVSNYSDNDFCTTVLGGRLSESGECK